MPRIRTYEASDVQLQPNERGMAAINREASADAQIAGAQENLARSDIGTAQAQGSVFSTIGRTLGQGVSDIGQEYVKYRTNQQIAHGAANLAGITSDLTLAHNEAMKSADPNDTSVGAKFDQQTLEPAFQKFVEGFDTEDGQRWARAQVNALRTHFTEKTIAAQSARSGVAVLQNVDTVTNKLSSTAMSDPSSTDTMLNLAGTSLVGIVASAPNLDPITAAKVQTELTQKAREEIAKGGVLGAINADPEEGLKMLNSGRYDAYINANTKEALTTHAAVVTRARAEQAKLNAAEQQKAFKQEAKATENQIYTSVIQPDGSVTLGPNFYPSVIAATQKYGPEFDAGTMIRFGQWAAEQAAKPEHVQTDPATYADFASRAYADDTDPHRLGMGEVVNARVRGLLSDSDFQHYADILGRERKPEEKAADKQFHEGLLSFKSFITDSSSFLGKANPVADQRWYEFQANAEAIRKQMAGKPLPEVLDVIRKSIPAFVVSTKAGAQNTLPGQVKSLPPVISPDQVAHGVVIVAPGDVGKLPGYVDTGGGSAKVRRYNPATGRIE